MSRANPFSRSCVVAGCSQSADYRGRCRKHAAVTDRLRGLASDRRHQDLYNSPQWKALRAFVLRQHPVCRCAECVRLGRVWPCAVVHHVRPHGGDRAKFFDPANLEALAKRCHDRITGGEGGYAKTMDENASRYRVAVSCESPQVGARGRA
jgi:5-methylcytosine-specific restriction protein A